MWLVNRIISLVTKPTRRGVKVRVGLIPIQFPRLYPCCPRIKGVLGYANAEGCKIVLMGFRLLESVDVLLCEERAWRIGSTFCRK